MIRKYIDTFTISSDGRLMDKHCSLLNGDYDVPFPNNARYVGTIKDGLFHGEGVLKLSNGDEYKGCFSKGRFNGSGTYTWADGEIYTGRFADGKMVPDDEPVSPSPDYNKGDFRIINGKRYGICQLNNDSIVYIGELDENGKPRGQGVIAYNNGTVYTGEVANNNPNGLGTLRETGGHIVTGLFEDGKPSRLCSILRKDASFYTGEVANNNPNGLGTAVFPDNEIVSGLYKDGNVSSGIFTSEKNGEICFSVYERRKFRGVVCRANKDAMPDLWNRLNPS